VRTLQENVWATGLDGSSPVSERWRERLADDYRNPALKITADEAVAHRLRRVYLPMFGIFDGAWVVRVTAFGTVAWPESAAIGEIPGAVVTAAVVVLFAGGTHLACRPRDWQARGELRATDIRETGRD
jgi:uncharacterized membrane protein